MTGATVLAALLAALVLPGVAVAAPPANDAPPAAAEFTPVAAENGTPDERQAIAELAEATADSGVPSFLGTGSFARTVLFRVPATNRPRELRVEGTGRTTDVLDLAAFVQPAGATNTGEPNSCAGRGGGGADAGADPTAGFVVRIPAGTGLLVQVGRRGAAGSPDDERAVVSLEERDLPAGRPTGDEAGAATPRVGIGRTEGVALDGATVTAEDPAQPACPSIGSVWRRYVAPIAGAYTVRVEGVQVGTLTLFRGERPTGENAAGCENRTRSAGDLGVDVTLATRQVLWVRMGTDRPPGDARAALTVGGPPGAGARRGVSAACTPAGGFRSVGARGRGRRVTLSFARRVNRPVTVDVFQQSLGRRVIGERLVGRFTRRTADFTWNGRANRRGRRVTDGYFIVRYRITGPGGVDVRRIALRRVRGRWSRRPAYAATEGCGLLRSAKLTRPVFGGRSNREIGAAFRLSRDARVTVRVLRLARRAALPDHDP